MNKNIHMPLVITQSPGDYNLKNISETNQTLPIMKFNRYGDKQFFISITTWTVFIIVVALSGILFIKWLHAYIKNSIHVMSENREIDKKEHELQLAEYEIKMQKEKMYYAANEEIYFRKCMVEFIQLANQLKIELENDKMSKNSIEVVFINRLTTLYKSMGSRRDEMLIYAPQHEDVIKTCRIRLGYKN